MSSPLQRPYVSIALLLISGVISEVSCFISAKIFIPPHSNPAFRPRSAPVSTIASLNAGFVSFRSSGKSGSVVSSSSSTSVLHFFDRIFEEEGPLGKGITVGKVQVSLFCPQRSSSSILSVLEKSSAAADLAPDSNRALSKLVSDVCLGLMRREEDWTGACSEKKWYAGKDAAKAERQFNSWSNKEASKFEKEYTPRNNANDEKPGGPTVVVVSIVCEIKGDATNFDGAGYSLAGTRDVLRGLAGDVQVDGGECINAAEVFWTPGEPDEVLAESDIVLDFPEIVTL